MVTLINKYGIDRLWKAFEFLDRSPVCADVYPDRELIVWYLEYFYETPQDLSILKYFPW